MPTSGKAISTARITSNVLASFENTARRFGSSPWARIKLPSMSRAAHSASSTVPPTETAACRIVRSEMRCLPT